MQRTCSTAPVVHVDVMQSAAPLTADPAASPQANAINQQEPGQASAGSPQPGGFEIAHRIIRQRCMKSGFSREAQLDTDLLYAIGGGRRHQESNTAQQQRGGAHCYNRASAGGVCVLY